MKKIILTGGGTAGHVMPNIALLPYLREKGYEIHYVGGKNGIEKDILADYPDVTYHGIDTGKLRRYHSTDNIKDVFKVAKGNVECKKILRQVKPDVIFSKGGYVALPLVTSSKSMRIPVLTHESDITPGLANRIIARTAEKVLTTFPETAPMIEKGKGLYVGAPIRADLFDGDRERGLSFLGLAGEKPVLAVMGGSKGARFVNETIRGNLEALCAKFDIVHMCGKDNVEDSDRTKAFADSYRQYEFIGKELPDVLAATDVVVTRGGSNSIHEFAALAKPMLIIPLSKQASRGDQVLNANSFEKRGLAVKLEEEELTSEKFLAALSGLYADREAYIARMKDAGFFNATERIFELIEEAAARGKRPLFGKRKSQDF
ncbi:MAG: undecaprenyldiphospho-muramoylpentapeptide beta-N-acetylglucosaminyltransferase [Clostridia bacterium]|nr:undecaprenyldiphospho-muramoylpentapeptide beta-N-acetylglucosaminyltransferase [Clostridia bacterium]